jgi:uncharacterized protein
VERLVTLRPGAPRRGAAATATGGLLDVGLVLTHACNLACTYCYTGDKKKVRMTDDVADRALAFAFERAATSGSRLQLELFGGEPLLERAMLVRIAEDARARAVATGVPLVMQTTTNGTLLTPDLVERLRMLGVHLALSIDGTRAQHEAGRPLAGGGSSYDAVRRGLALLLDADAAFDVIAVVDPCNVAQLSEGVLELAEAGVEAITLNVNWGARWDEAALVELEQQLERVAAVILAWTRAGRWLRVQPLESALRSQLDRGEVVTASCSAGTGRLAVAPSGRIYACARSVGEDDGRAAIGHIDRGIDVPGLVEHGCRCANAEETGDAAVAGPVRMRHDRALADITSRLAAQLGRELAQIVITDRGHTP